MWLIITILAYSVAKSISRKINHPLVVPILITIPIIISLLIFSDTSYSVYYINNKVITYMLQPAIVAMAYPIYSQMASIKENIKIVIGTCMLGSIFSMSISSAIAMYLGADMRLVASVIVKSVTTPIALATSVQLGGSESLTAVLVLIAGLFGAVIAYPIYRFLGINNEIIRGLVTGASAHALGTAQAQKYSPVDAAYSSIALILCGVFTALLAPLIFFLIYHYAS